MDVKTYRAKTIQAALELVRRDLGPDAAVLHTRQMRNGLMGWLSGQTHIEVVASTAVNVPSRFTGSAPEIPSPRNREIESPLDVETNNLPHNSPANNHQDCRNTIRDEVQIQLSDLQSLVESLHQRNHKNSQALPEVLFRLFTELIDVDVTEDLAREFINRVRTDADKSEMDNPALLKARIASMIESEIKVTGPLQVSENGACVVALVGPTGVGKTTTIAKLAANYRLREKVRVGLITVDTYRIAAVEQLRTYADIISLPMEVVSTPKEMREAVTRLSHLDLVLMDTAGRSPRDEVKIQELKSMLAEAQADEVHLVLSSVNGAASLKKTAAMFSEVGTTALILTKLDETTGLGNLLPLLRSCQLPLSYLTDGQNVPDDIEPAEQRRLARLVLGM